MGIVISSVQPLILQLENGIWSEEWR